MRLANLAKRIAALEPEHVNYCPFCDCLNERVKALSDEELTELIAYLDSKCATVSSGLEKWFSKISEPSPTCPYCTSTTAMSEEELDAELAKLVDILQYLGYEAQY